MIMEQAQKAELSLVSASDSTSVFLVVHAEFVLNCSMRPLGVAGGEGCQDTAGGDQ